MYGLSFSQSAKVTKGQKYYQFYNYFKTIDKYEPLTDKTTEIKRELALSYFNTAQYELSEKYFLELVNLDDKTADDIYNYVKVLLINQKYSVAKIWMTEFQRLAPTDTRATLFASDIGFYNDLQQDNGYFSIKNLDINTEAEDFAPAFYKNQVVFTSSRQGITPIKRKWNWNNLPFLDLYIANADSSSLELSDIKQFNFNKKFHEGTVSFNKNADYMIYTSNNYKQKSSDGVYKLEMYYTIFSDNKWQKPEPMPFNDPEYSVGHPSLSADGKILFFASDMPGGHGGVDIYVSTLNSLGEWSNPVNLGNDINTAGNEMFPFYHADGYIFFASNGHPGLGGLDLFVTQKDGTGYKKPQNLGAPINTNFDDFAFIINQELTQGYYSSNRFSGKGNDDIYSFNLLKPFFAKKIITGITKDNLGNILPDVNVTLFGQNGDELGAVISDTNGYFTFTVEPDKIFTIAGKKPVYKDDVKIVSTKVPELEVKTELILSKVPEFSFYGLITDFKTKNIIDSVSVLIIDKTDNINYNLSTDNLGEFTTSVNNITLNSVNDYEIIIKKHGYIPVDKDFTITFDHEGEYDLSDVLDIELHKLNIGDDIAKTLNVNPIYFDLSKWNIRADAAIELDKIVKVMNDYPTLVIELGSHTDSRGSDASNQTLSQKRATSSADYIKQKITNPSRITGRGYGETTNFVINQETHDEYDFLPLGQILDNDFIYSLTRSQQQIAHQLNRRTEFKIISY